MEKEFGFYRNTLTGCEAEGLKSPNLMLVELIDECLCKKKKKTFYDQSELKRGTIIFPSRFCGTFWMRRVAVTTEGQTALHNVPC